MKSNIGELDVTDLVKRIEKLEIAIFRKKGASGDPAANTHGRRPTEPKEPLDFSIPIRAFVKKYSVGMNGPRKFVLIVAYLTRGDLTRHASLADIQAEWNRMTSKGVLGMKFNRFYTAQARENDWVNAEKVGSYFLRPRWTEIIDD
jgi:hypothetical protein